MEQINLGSLPDGAGGDSLRVAFEKCNDNFSGLDERLKQLLQKTEQLERELAQLKLSRP
ncbi:MAG: hypothetical protein E7I45_10915 [Eikenella corrodens]|uniref:hypothetical protein n=1 Tax=Eikenella corrodens TaxID=539 RepID=UPI0029148B80|nr:hypothetical protein [Eikenella corrodens]MDU4301461.1 hypothetical protein [Eikenella corrodens]